MLNPALQDDPEVLRNMPEVRRREMAAAQEILGVQHSWLGFVDSGLPEGDPLPPLPEGCFALEPIEVTAEALVRVIREFRPHVMTTYDENGGYPHPDHIMCHTVSMAAFRTRRRPEALPARGRAVAAAEALLQPDDERGRIVRPSTTPWWRPAWSRPTPSGSSAGRTAASGHHHAGARARRTSPSATRRCWRTPPRSTPTAPGSPCRWTCSRRSGRPRTTRLRCPTCRSAADRGRPVRRAGLPRGGHRDGDQHRAADRVRRHG